MEYPMEYTLELCSYYKKLTVGSTPVYIFDPHNMALPVWGTFATKYGPMNLVTFDTHADTQCAFTSYLGDREIKSYWEREKVLAVPEVRELLKEMKLRKEEFSFEDCYKYANEMFNTEQIQTGIVLDYLKSYTVILHHTGYEEDDRLFGLDATYINDTDLRVPVIRQPLMLDFDLDYFEDEDDFIRVKEIGTDAIRNAKAITIAREPKYCKDYTWSVEEIETKLLEMLTEVLKGDYQRC